MWTPDPELLRATRGILMDEADALLEGAPAPEHDVTFLEALGTLVALGAAQGPDLEPKPGVTQALSARLASLELPALDDAAVDFLELAPRCLTLDETEWDDTLRPLFQALACRDRVELAWMGAQALGLEKGISEEAQVSRLSFDGMLGDALWQLLPLNARRRAALGWMSPQHHARFAWWSLGAELPDDALLNPARADEVLKLFPAAARFVQVARRMAPRTKAPVVSLVDRLKKRTQGEGLRWAAATEAGTVPLPASRFAELAFRASPPQLVVDVLRPLRAGKVPELLVGAGRRVLVPGPEEGLGRFVFDLHGVSEAQAVLRLPLEHGDEEVTVE